jgi:hypothetical protein
MSNAEQAEHCRRIEFKLCFIYRFTGLFKRMLGKKQGRAGWDWGGTLFPLSRDCFIFNENYSMVIV